MIKMYVGIVGSRRFEDRVFVERLMEGIVRRYGNVVFISDCGIVEEVCKRRSWNLICGFRIDWCDVVYCVVEIGYSSKMIFEMCKLCGVKVVWIEVDDGEVVDVSGDVDLMVNMCKEFKNGFCLVLGEKCKYDWWNCKLRKICEEIRKESEVK